LFGDINPCADQARVRYAGLREAGWDVAYFHGDYVEDGSEEDEYDLSPNTEYLVCYDGTRPLGVLRLIPTDEKFMLAGKQRSFMLRDIFTESTEKREACVTHEALDAVGSKGYFIEGTRLVLDPCLDRGKTQEAISHLAVAMIQRGYDRGAHSFVCIMPPGVWESVWGRRGCPYTFIGEAVDLGREGTVQAATLEVSEDVLARMKEVTGLQDMVLDMGPEKIADKLRQQAKSEDYLLMGYG
jgi:N-acyl-L-homoserine lactone synthetase